MDCIKMHVLSDLLADAWKIAVTKTRTDLMTLAPRKLGCFVKQVNLVIRLPLGQCKLDIFYIAQCNYSVTAHVLCVSTAVQCMHIMQGL